MAEIGTITAIFAAIKAAVNGLNGLKELGLSAKHAEAVDAAMDVMRETQDSLNAVHSEIIELRDENNRLRRAIEEHDNWQSRLDQYALVRTAGGAQVYQNGDPPNHHYACPACIENHQIQILQDGRNMAGSFRCPSCNASFPVDPTQTFRDIDYGPGGAP